MPLSAVVVNPYCQGALSRLVDIIYSRPRVRVHGGRSSVCVLRALIGFQTALAGFYRKFAAEPAGPFRRDYPISFRRDLLRVTKFDFLQFLNLLRDALASLRYRIAGGQLSD